MSAVKSRHSERKEYPVKQNFKIIAKMQSIRMLTEYRLFFIVIACRKLCLNICCSHARICFPFLKMRGLPPWLFFYFALLQAKTRIF